MTGGESKRPIHAEIRPRAERKMRPRHTYIVGHSGNPHATPTCCPWKVRQGLRCLIVAIVSQNTGVVSTALWRLEDRGKKKVTERDTVAAGRMDALNISQTVDLLGFQHLHDHPWGLQRTLLEKRKWGAVLWMKLPCWCQRLELEYRLETTEKQQYLNNH